MKATNHELINGDCLEVVGGSTESWHCIFADPPDNLCLKYGHMNDDLPEEDYVAWLEACFRAFFAKAPIVWISFNARWQFRVGEIVSRMLRDLPQLRAKQCVQVFTFGQHNHYDLGNNYRPLLRLMFHDTPLYPDAVRVLSQRQLTGDKRADPRGRVPSDVFSFPRVVGNSKQRRGWHPTQINEGLVERCVKLSTLKGQRVLDPFAGTGTTLRVCEKIGRPCTLIENSKEYCNCIAMEHRIAVTTKPRTLRTEENPGGTDK